MNSVEEKILAAARYKLNVDEKVRDGVLFCDIVSPYTVHVLVCLTYSTGQNQKDETLTQ